MAIPRKRLMTGTGRVGQSHLQRWSRVEACPHNAKAQLRAILLAKRLTAQTCEHSARRTTQRLHLAPVCCSVSLDGAFLWAHRAPALRRGTSGLLPRSRPLRAARLSRGTEAHAPVLVPARARLPPTTIRLGHWTSSREQVTPSRRRVRPTLIGLRTVSPPPTFSCHAILQNRMIGRKATQQFHRIERVYSPGMGGSAGPDAAP